MSSNENHQAKIHHQTNSQILNSDQQAKSKTDPNSAIKNDADSNNNKLNDNEINNSTKGERIRDCINQCLR